MATIDSKQDLAVRVVPGISLNSELKASWGRLLASNPDLASPFFAPEYTLAVAASIPEVSVGIAERRGEPVAFLPFERGAFNVGKRLRLCDYQGLIAAPGFDLDMAWFVRSCGLRAWDFDHLVASQPQFKACHRVLAESPIMDVSSGYPAYLEERRFLGQTELIKRCGTKLRKLEREAGEVRFEIHVEDEAILRQLLVWREAKYGSRHSHDLLLGILGSLLPKQETHLRSALSVVYAGNEVVAAHFGLRSRSTWHWWFPAYNPKFEKYSPGIIMILKMAEHAADAGVRIIDFGKGDQDYKGLLMNGSNALAEGSVEVSPWLSLSRSSERMARSWVKKSPLLGRAARHLRGLAQRGAANSQ